MDLASSPSKPTEDIEFDLDDVPEVSTQPNQDLMVQDEPEQPIADSDATQSAFVHNVDDDLMIDEEILVEDEEDQTLLPDLSMDNHQEEQVQVDEDDDILYEDEEDLQKQDYLPEDLAEEQRVEDGVNTEDQQLIPKVQTSGNFDDVLHADIEFDFHSYEVTQEVEQIRTSPAQLQRASMDKAADDKPGTNSQTDNNIHTEPDSVARLTENSFGDDASKHGVNKGNNLAVIEVNEAETLELEENATDIHKQDTDRPKVVDDASLIQALETESPSNAQATTGSIHEESNRQSITHVPVPHTVKVHYLETEMCLFPPTEDDDLEMFFLQDVSLAYESLDKMLGACREVLANTIGEDDELVLDVASLGLHISEVSQLNNLC